MVDETIGNFVNVEVLPYADVVVSSLTKIFSGDANAMGGRWVAFLACLKANTDWLVVFRWTVSCLTLQVDTTKS